jgi:hypothetical protein
MIGSPVPWSGPAQGPGQRQVRADAGDHVADVGHPLAEVLVLAAGEGRGVFLQDHLQGRERRQALGADQGVDLRQQRPVADDLQVALEDVGLGRAELLGDLRDDRLQLRGGGRHGAIEPLDLAGDQARVAEVLGLVGAEDRIDPVGDPTDTPGLTATPLCMACSVLSFAPAASRPAGPSGPTRSARPGGRPARGPIPGVGWGGGQVGRWSDRTEGGEPGRSEHRTGVPRRRPIA